jgi:hypothetical protein
MEMPWWVGFPGIAVTIFGAYQAYESQRSLFTFSDAQMIAAQMQIYGMQSPSKFAGLDDKTADSFGLSKAYSGSLERSKLTFAPAEKNGVAGGSYTITVRGLNKGDCQNLEPNI